MTCPDCDGAGCPECTLPRRGSGAPSEAYYRAHGYHQIKVRLPLDAIDLLDRLVESVDDHEEELGEGEPKASRGIVLDALIRCVDGLAKAAGEDSAAAELAAAIRLRRA